MEATALSVGKSVLDGALGYAKSALAEEVALQLGIQRDHAFIRDELQMMQAFLLVAHDDQDKHKVLMAWVKQVRDVAYDAEDCLQDFSIHLKEPSWWRRPHTLLERRRIAKQMKELRARVEDVSQRNLRYQLTRTSSLKPASDAEMSSVTAATVFGIGEARRAARQEEPKEDLVSLINMEGEDLRVIALWGTSGNLGMTTIINAAYENPDVKQKFQCRAWIRILHPFNPNDFIQTLVKQFRSGEGVHILLEQEKTGHDLAMEFTRYVNEKSYLIVLTNLSADQTIYAFYEKDTHDRMKTPMPMSSSMNATTSTNNTNEVQENQCKGGDDGKVITKSLTRIQTMASALQESQLIGREKEKSKLVEFLSCQSSQDPRVISVCGMGGLGKTSLVKDVYRTQTMFQKRAFVTVLRPFNLTDLLKSLIVQLQAESSETKTSADSRLDTRNKIAMMGLHSLIKELNILIKEKRCLIVLDDVSSTKEWDDIIKHFPNLSACWILVTTREQIIAKHCSKKQDNICNLKVLEDEEALELFTKKVFKEAIDWDKHPELIEEAQLILKKCGGLPLAIVTIGGFLANQPKIVVEWRKLIEHISAELEMNPELEAIRTILGKSYDGLPYHLKSCFLYMSIFPEDHIISRRRLVRRWVAEGYSRELREKSAEEISDSYFTKLIDRSMILPSKKNFGSIKGIDSCQVHDLMREISISKSTEENLVFRLEGSCSSNTQEIVRHLTINSNWTGDRSDFESAVDLSRIRSLTVFGEWRSFYISKNMRLLRVLDLESTTGLVDHHLEHIGSLVHLKYISLRGCLGIYHLPDSWGNLLQLETLDIKYTRICALPRTIIKLSKLKHLFGGELEPWCVYSNDRIPSELMELCLACCAPKYLKDVEYLDGNPNMHDVCTFWGHVIFPTLASRRLDPWGIVLPKGIQKLKNLHTLGLVNTTGGKAILLEIKRLTQLRKLAVRGVNKKNYKEFCSAVAELARLESLSVESPPGSSLHGLLDEVSTLPSNLQSLKLSGVLVKLPKWISMLQNLVKLVLQDTELLEVDGTMKALGELPNLAILRLLGGTFDYDQVEVRVTFCREVPFRSLMVLELGRYIRGLSSVEFQEAAAPKLELLRFDGSPLAPSNLFSGLATLQNLKEFEQDNQTYNFEKNVQTQLANNPNRPIFKKLNRDSWLV